MQKGKLFNAIGLMSGTSMDGIDVAFLQSDGKSVIKNKYFSYFPYDDDFRQKISHLISSKSSSDETQKIEREFTDLNASIVEIFLKEHAIDRKEVDLIAFPGHTIFHDPGNSITRQIGDLELLQSKTKIKTIGNFRKEDVSSGGQGAPLVPVYHFYMTKSLEKPIAILNIGGINNVTYIPTDKEDDMVAFDVCFGNAPFDDLISQSTNSKFDKNGEIGLSGAVNQEICEKILQNDIFYKTLPKSFDRNDFEQVLRPLRHLDLADSLASLSYIHAKVLAANIDLFMKEKPGSLFICGGGVKNQSLMKCMREELSDIKIDSTVQIGFSPDQIEAQAFAFIGIRKLLGLAISFQKTTGILLETDSSLAFSQH